VVPSEVDGDQILPDRQSLSTQPRGGDPSPDPSFMQKPGSSTAAADVSCSPPSDRRERPIEAAPSPAPSRMQEPGHQQRPRTFALPCQTMGRARMLLRVPRPRRSGAGPAILRRLSEVEENVAELSKGLCHLTGLVTTVKETLKMLTENGTTLRTGGVADYRASAALCPPKSDSKPKGLYDEIMGKQVRHLDLIFSQEQLGRCL